MPTGVYLKSEEHKKKIGKANKKALKGHIGYWLGKHHYKETKEKISEKLTGRKSPEGSKTRKRKFASGELVVWNKGKKLPYLSGENSGVWQGGKSFEPYGLEFNKDLKEVIRNRDRRKCQICEKTELEERRKLDVHHIDYNKKNNDPKNLISLCQKCHLKTNHNRRYWIKYFEKYE